MRLSLFALALVACSAQGLEVGDNTNDTSSTLPACDTLATESDCKARTDCIANECGFCGGTEYLGCTGPGEVVGCSPPSAGCPALCPSQGDADHCAAQGCTPVFEADLTFKTCVNSGQSCTAPENVECLWEVNCPAGYAPLYDTVCAEYCIATSDCAS